MKTKKAKAVVIALAAITGASYAQEVKIAAAALRDIKNDMGTANTFSIADDPFISYKWDPMDGECA